MENSFKTQLSQHLFWDIDKASYDVDKYPEWTVQRILEYGNLKDWKLIREYYGLEKIVAICKSLRTLSPEALSYICLISHTNKEDYRCYHTSQLNHTLWNS
jgi:hypothetical protein